MPKFDAILNYSIKDIKLKTKKDSYLSNCLFVRRQGLEPWTH